MSTPLSDMTLQEQVDKIRDVVEGILNRLHNHQLAIHNLSDEVLELKRRMEGWADDE
jgi:hypothetical protein